MQYKLGFLGCGNMGGALAAAAAKTLGKGEIAVCDLNKEKVAQLEKTCGVHGVDEVTLVTQTDFLILGVKPQVMEAVLEPIAPLVRARKDLTVVTMAAGVSIAGLRGMLGGATAPVIRIMPNTPAQVGEGMILYALDGVSEEIHAVFRQYFQAAGKFALLPEEQIDAGCAVSGSGPAFVYAFAEALAKGGVACGLAEKDAALFTAQTLKGAAEMLLQFGDPVSLRQAVCSPNGTTLAGVAALEKGDFWRVAQSAVEGAYRRALELKK